MSNPYADQRLDYTEQATIYYNPEISKHKELVAYAKSRAKTLHLPFDKMPQAFNVWTAIWKAVTKESARVYDDTHPEYKNIQTQESNFRDWYKVVVNNKALFAYPIVVSPNGIRICRTSSDIYGLAGLGM